MYKKEIRFMLYKFSNDIKSYFSRQITTVVLFSGRLKTEAEG